MCLKYYILLLATLSNKKQKREVQLYNIFFDRMDWPVRTISFSYDGQLLASASEDLIIDIGFVETGDKIADISVEAATFTVAWHPSMYFLAYACDDKDAYDRKRDAGSLKVWGFPSD